LLMDAKGNNSGSEQTYASTDRREAKVKSPPTPYDIIQPKVVVKKKYDSSKKKKNSSATNVKMF